MTTAKRSLIILILCVGFIATDFFNEDFGLFRTEVGLAKETDINIEKALDVFDRVCLTPTVYRVPPYPFTEALTEAGFSELRPNTYQNADSSMYVQLGDREDSPIGVECVVTFLNYDDMTETVKPGFIHFADHRLSQPMAEQEGIVEFDQDQSDGAQVAQSEDTLVITRFFGDSEKMYYLSLKPYFTSGTQHQLHLVVVDSPESH